jgi:hypothetical protein
MHHQVQELVDRIWEDTKFHSNPRMWEEHPAMSELLALPKNVVTPILLEMLQQDPNWIILSALRLFHGEEGARWPTGDNGRFTRICEHWVQWGIARNHLGLVDPDEVTDETRS